MAISHLGMKQAQFISLMSESLGVEEKTMKVIVRTLREAGLFTTGARGVNAPDITSLDAVRVVLAVVASQSPSRSIKDVLYFGALKPDLREECLDNTAMLGLDPEKTLEQTLVDYLENCLNNSRLRNAVLCLSDVGSTGIFSPDIDQNYYQREHCAAVMAETDMPKKVELLGQWEVMQRIKDAKVQRSAKIPLETILKIGFEMIGIDQKWIIETVEE